MISKILKSFGYVKKATTSTIAPPDFWYRWTRYSNNELNDEQAMNMAYLGNDIAYSVINKVSRVVGGLPIKLKKNDKQIYAGKEFLELIKRPNTRQSIQNLWAEASIYLLTTGDAYIWRPVEAVGFASSKTYILPSQQVEARCANNKSIFDEPEYYQFTDNSKIFNILPNEITHIQFVNPSMTAQMRRDGLSPFRPGQNVLKASNHLQNAEANIFENGGANKLIAAGTGADAMMMPADKELLEKALIERRGGSDGFNKALVIQSSAQVLDLGLSPEELKMFEANLTHLRKICNLLGIDSSLFNDPANKTYANRQDAEKAFYNDLILPLAAQFIQAYEISILPDYPNCEIFVDVNEIAALNESPLERRKRMLEEVKAGVISVDEWREHFNYEKYGGEYARPKTNQTGINQTQGPANGANNL